MFDSISYNGHPVLWHLILHPFASLGFPYATMFIIHLCLAVSAVFLLLKYSPFSRLTKVFFIFSYFMSYEYSVIARNHCISILLIFAIASFYRLRFDRPFTYALLVNTNVHSLFIGSSLICIYFLELLADRKLDRIKFASLSLTLFPGPGTPRISSGTGDSKTTLSLLFPRENPPEEKFFLFRVIQ